MSHLGYKRLLRPSLWVLVAGLFVAFGARGSAIVTDLTNVRLVHTAAAEHITQGELRDLLREDPAAGGKAFREAFEIGDELFATTFNALDGIGANVGRGQRFTRV